ncbi:hypothetical protein TELCIR_02279 [Teladorsagia circumcincta]|uniref:SCP domain-containing protein n=1 Tax=Teladorsagia circumcincta TaxID=45464 RepID=A0A2G9UZL7_TELCI|nr:hypothetical protein TELCIR_02279 [Teladorsagia circumcincta]
MIPNTSGKALQSIRSLSMISDVYRIARDILKALFNDEVTLKNIIDTKLAFTRLPFSLCSRDYRTATNRTLLNLCENAGQSLYYYRNGYQSLKQLKQPLRQQTAAMSLKTSSKATEETTATSKAATTTESTAMSSEASSNAKEETNATSKVATTTESTAMSSEASSNATEGTSAISKAAGTTETSAMSSEASSNATEETTATSKAARTTESTAMSSEASSNATEGTTAFSKAATTTESTAMSSEASSNAREETTATSKAATTTDSTAMSSEASSNTTEETNATSKAATTFEITAISSEASSNATEETTTTSKATTTEATTVASTTTTATSATTTPPTPMTEALRLKVIDMHNYRRSRLAQGLVSNAETFKNAPPGSNMYELMAWATTYQVGCGIRRCENQGSTVVVCRYHPRDAGCSDHGYDVDEGVAIPWGPINANSNARCSLRSRTQTNVPCNPPYPNNFYSRIWYSKGRLDECNLVAVFYNMFL